MSAVNPVSGAASAHLADAYARLHERKTKERGKGPDPPDETASRRSPLRLTQEEVLRLLRTSAERFEEMISSGVDVEGAAATAGFRVDSYA